MTALPDFSERHPGIQVHLAEAEGEDQLLAIARGEVDLVACRRPPVIPEGWEFHPVREDRLAVVCRAGHPLARARRPAAADLAAATWLLLPAGLAARTRFDELAAGFPAPPPVHPVITRSLPMLWRLLLQRPLLALLPLHLARPLLDSGELVELDLGAAAPLQPIGVLQPQAGMGTAARALAEALRALAPRAA